MTPRARSLASPWRLPGLTTLGAFAPLLLPLPALAEDTTAGAERAPLYFALGLLAFVLLTGAFLGVLSARMSAAARQAAESSNDQARVAFLRLADLPFGAPEGTVRGILAFFVIVFGFIILAFQEHFGLKSAEAIAGFVGAVISFYFAARAGEQARQVADQAAQVVRDVQSTVAQQAQRDTQGADARVDAARREGAESAAAAQTGTAQAGGRLAEARAVLDVAKVVAGAAARLAPQSDTAQRVAQIADTAGRTLDGLTAALHSGDAAKIAGVAQGAGDLIAAVAGRDNPATSLLSDAIAGFQMGSAGTALLGLGGPVGLIAAIGVGAFQAYSKGTEHFERWKARLLDRPYTTNLFPPLPVDAAVALAALEASPIFARVYLRPEIEDRFAEARSIADAARLDTEAATEKLFAGDRRADFASEDEFQAGLQEFRGRLLDDVLAKVDPAPIEIGRIPGVAPASIDQQTLRSTVQTLRHDPQARDLDSAVLLLTGLPTSPDVKESDAMAMLGHQLAAAQADAARAEPGTPPVPQDPVS